MRKTFWSPEWLYIYFSSKSQYHTLSLKKKNNNSKFLSCRIFPSWLSSLYWHPNTDYSSSARIFLFMLHSHNSSRGWITWCLWGRDLQSQRRGLALPQHCDQGQTAYPFHGSVSSLLDYFIQEIFTEQRYCARYYSGYWECIGEQKSSSSQSEHSSGGQKIKDAGVNI